MKGSPFTTYPSGWFRIAWAYDLAVGEVRPLRYFGEDLVLYRGESGEPHVLSAFCGHLGAHLGFGGRVCDDDIVCPFHGWRWGADGSNVEIPYDEAPFPRVRIAPWCAIERGGMILVWYDAVDRATPTWTPPEIAQTNDPSFYPVSPATTTVWAGRRVSPENPIENLVDPAHLKYVHGAGKIPDVAGFTTDGHTFVSDLRYAFGEGRERTWLTPDGPVMVNFRAEAFGLGFGVTTYDGIHRTVQIYGVTPVDGEIGDVWTTVLPQRAEGDAGDVPSGTCARIVSHFSEQFEVDLPIWENMRYAMHPPYPKLESKIYSTVRRWSRQFYPHEPVVSRSTANTD
jgi:phenylpropionate dioxygenase-like ring-hydroxylating dioxygenase large terminal subunit